MALTAILNHSQRPWNFHLLRILADLINNCLKPILTEPEFFTQFPSQLSQHRVTVNRLRDFSLGEQDGPIRRTTPEQGGDQNVGVKYGRLSHSYLS